MVITVAILPPTARLPPIKALNDAPLALLHDAVQYLQSIYNPEIRSSRRINHKSAPKTPPSGSGSEPAHDITASSDKATTTGSMRADAFEHAYSVRWLTALIAQKTTLHENDDDDDDTAQELELERLVQSAAALLAVCAGAASAGTRTRTYVLCGVRVQLTDVALRNDDFGSVGAQTWGGACVLAEMIAEAPARFGLCSGDGNDDNRGGGSGDDDDDFAPTSFPHCRGHDGSSSLGPAATTIRVLELGAGTGLVSLTIVGSILRGMTDRCKRDWRDAEIVASDFYTPALDNLRLNIQHNFPPKTDPDSTTPAPAHSVSISAHLFDWEEAADPAPPLEAPFDVPFDEVFGADIVYELDHAAWINACLKRVLRLTGRFHLVIPLRKGFTRESATVERVFPHVQDRHWLIEAGPSLCITHKEDITCEAWPEGNGEVEYVYYTIQWVVGEDTAGFTRGDRSVQ